MLNSKVDRNYNGDIIVKKQVYSFEQLSKLGTNPRIDKDLTEKQERRAIDTSYSASFRPDNRYDSMTIAQFAPYIHFLSQQQYSNPAIKKAIAHVIMTTKNSLEFKRSIPVIINPYRVNNKSVLKERERVLASKKQLLKEAKKIGAASKKSSELTIDDVKYHMMLKPYDKLNKAERMKHVVAQEGIYFLRQFGVQRITFPEMSKMTEIPVGGLISYYPSQDAMAYEISKYHQEEFLFHVLDTALTAEDGIQRTFALISSWINWILRDDMRDLLVSMLSELSVMPDDSQLKELVNVTMQMMETSIKDSIKTAIQKKELNLEAKDVDSFTDELIGALLIAHHQRYFVKNKESAFNYAFKAVNKALQIK